MSLKSFITNLFKSNTKKKEITKSNVNLKMITLDTKLSDDELDILETFADNSVCKCTHNIGFNIGENIITKEDMNELFKNTFDLNNDVTSKIILNTFRNVFKSRNKLYMIIPISKNYKTVFGYSIIPIDQTLAHDEIEGVCTFLEEKIDQLINNPISDNCSIYRNSLIVKNDSYLETYIIRYVNIYRLLNNLKKLDENVWSTSRPIYFSDSYKFFNCPFLKKYKTRLKDNNIVIVR